MGCTAPGAGTGADSVADAAPLPVLAYGEASGLGRIMRARMRGVFGDGPESALAQGVAVVFTAHHAALLKTMALENDFEGAALAEARSEIEGKPEFTKPMIRMRHGIEDAQ